MTFFLAHFKRLSLWRAVSEGAGFLFLYCRCEHNDTTLPTVDLDTDMSFLHEICRKE